MWGGEGNGMVAAAIGACRAIAIIPARTKTIGGEDNDAGVGVGSGSTTKED